MRKDKRNIILFTVILVFLIAFLVAYNMYMEGPVNVQTGRYIETNPVSLYTSFLTDSINARKQYDGKIVRISGKIIGVTENTEKQQVILFKTSMTGGNINCTMENAVPGIDTGSVITVQGMCKGMGQGDPDLGIPGDVYLTRAVLAN